MNANATVSAEISFPLANPNLNAENPLVTRDNTIPVEIVKQCSNILIIREVKTQNKFQPNSKVYNLLFLSSKYAYYLTF